MGGGTGSVQAGTMFAGKLINILGLGGVTFIAIPTTGVVYSQSFLLPRSVTFGWEVQFTSSGVCTVTVELEQANQPPTTEGAQDDAFTIPVNKLTTNGLFPTGIIVAQGTKYMTAYSPDASAYGRLRITGTGANDASTRITVARFYAVKNT